MLLGNYGKMERTFAEFPKKLFIEAFNVYFETISVSLYATWCEALVCQSL